MAKKKVKIKGHRREDGTKVKGHTRVVHTKRHHLEDDMPRPREMSEKRRKRIGRRIKKNLKRLMRAARR